MAKFPAAGEVLGDEVRIGSASEIEAVVRALADARDEAETFALDMQRAANLLPAMVSDTTRQLSARLEAGVIPSASALYLSADESHRAFVTYLEHFNEIRRRADRVEVRVAASLELIEVDMVRIADLAHLLGCAGSTAWNVAPPLDVPQGLGALTTAQEEARAAWRSAALRWEATLAAIEFDRREWRSLFEDRKAAESALRRALDHTVIGEIVALAAERDGGVEAVIKTLVIAGAGARVWDGTSPVTEHTLLLGLIGTTDGTHVWDSPPNPDEVATRWSAMPEWKRDELIASVPWVVGNLPGIPFADRDRANRLMLNAYIANQAGLSAQSRLALAEVVKVTLGDQVGPPRSIVALDLGDGIPRVAIGYGALDTAEHLNWGVPGMLNDAHRAIPSWDRAMVNQSDGQRRVIQFTGTTDDTALVAFLSYDTPNLVTVLGEDAARAGAERLAAELDGAYAARAAGQPLVTHGAFGHSYGTTTLVAAASHIDHPLSHMTLIGSAGLDARDLESFADVRVTHNEAGHPNVYSTLAATDSLARFGTDMSGRLQPNPGAEKLPWLTPGDVYVFSSDGFEEYKATQGHSLINSDGTGYLDQQTQAGAALAAIATGNADQAPGGVEFVSKPREHEYSGPGVYGLAKGMKQ